jgi:hypothetical protein
MTAPDGRPAIRPIELRDARTIQILSTEHWSLLSARALSWSESFSRASMLLATLSATVVSLALAAQATSVGRGFLAFAVVVLPFVEVVGVATFARLGEANVEDIQSIHGMNRIRHAYLEIAPGLEPYFVSGRYDDLASVLSAYGTSPVVGSSGRERLHHAFVMTQGMVGLINAMVAAAFGFALALLVDLPVGAAIGVAALLLVGALVAQMRLGRWIYGRLDRSMRSRFPAPADLRTAPSQRRRRPGDRATLPNVVPALRDYPWRTTRPSSADERE